MNRIWDQMGRPAPKRKRLVRVAQKEAKYVLKQLHAGKEPDLVKWHAQRAATRERKLRERETLRHLRSLGML
jgi:hypothetical protein